MPFLATNFYFDLFYGYLVYWIHFEISAIRINCYTLLLTKINITANQLYKLELKHIKVQNLKPNN